MLTLVGFWGFQTLSRAKSCLHAKLYLKTHCSQQMIKERCKGSQSFRLFFFGFFLLGSFSDTILSLFVHTSWPESASSIIFSLSPIPPTPPTVLSVLPYKDLGWIPFLFQTCPTFFPSDLVKTCPFKIKPSEHPEMKSSISYIPWTKAKLKFSQKIPKVNWECKNPHRLAEEYMSHSNSSTWLL